MYYFGVGLGVFFMFMVALIPWIGFSNFFNSTETGKKETRRTLYMPIYKDKENK